MAKAEPRNALLQAMRLLEDISGTGKIASAGSRVAVTQLIGAGSFERLSQVVGDELKPMLNSALSWSSDPVSDEVVEAAIEALQSERDGRSCYAQAAEAVGFAAVVAPLVSEAALLDLFDAARFTPSAYSPIKYTAVATVGLKKLIHHFPIEVRDRLAVSLWDTAHEGRWWDSTVRLGRRYPTSEIRVAFEDLSDRELVELWLQGEFSYSPMAAARLASLDSLPADIKRSVLQFVSASRNPDVVVLASYLRPIPLDRRPDGPVVTLLEALKTVLDGNDPAEALPVRPQTWGALYPQTDVTLFNVPQEALALDGTEIPGLPGSKIIVVRHLAALLEEADFMANSVDGWRFNAEDGSSVVFRLEAGRESADLVLTWNGSSWDRVILGRIRAGVEQLDPALKQAASAITL